MSFRVPPNKGVIEFPAILHIRVTQAMHAEVTARGGARWLRPIIEANTRPPPPAATMPGDKIGGADKRVTRMPAKRTHRVTRRQSGRPARSLVTLDKRKGRGV